MKIIGLTGGIGSGKSTVAAILTQLGETVIDADQLAREAVKPGTPAYESIISSFGRDILQTDCTINRKVLGHIVFADPEARHRLESITHPAIRALFRERTEQLRQEGKDLAFYMAPLLIEAGVADNVDEIWVVYVDEATQIQRVMERDHLSRDEAQLRLAAQMPMDEKRKYGSVVIDNCGEPEETELQVRRIWEERVK